MNMKRINLFFFMALFVLPIFSQSEGYDKAKLVAEKFLLQKNGVVLKNDSASRHKVPRQNLSLELAYNVKEAEKNLLYVFTCKEQKEFAIVTADKSEPMVVGYSTNQAFDKDNIIPPVKAFMDAYAKMAKEGKAIRKVVGTEKASIYPLVKTFWSQEEPYNQDCPDYPQWWCVVGCGPLAMGQIMKYYEYPTHGIGEHGGINFAEQTYDFTKMLCGHVPGSGAGEVAKLLHHAGVAADTEYSSEYSYTGGAGTDPLKTVSALKEYFGYSESAMMKMRHDISDSDWDEMVYNELTNKHPLIYGGYPSEGLGHLFIVDGYNDGYYHVNWGWGGKQDGYYLLSALQEYNYSQMASFGLVPDGWTPADEPESDLLTIGFCDNSIAAFASPYGDDGDFRATSSIPYSHIIPYVGKKMIGVQIGLAEDVTGLKVMLKSSEFENPFYTQEVGVGHVGWNTILFDTPQTIPANDIFYEYTFDPKPNSHPVGRASENPGNAMYGRDGVSCIVWYEENMGYSGERGILSFRIILAEDTEMPADLRLLQMEPVRVVSDSHSKITGIIENTSGRAITNYTLKYRIDDLPTETLFMNHPLQKNERTFFSFDIEKEMTPGDHELRVWVAEVDGQPDAVMANSNYYVTSPLFFKTSGDKSFPRTHVIDAEVDVYCGFSSVYGETQEKVERSGQYDCIFINHHIQNMGPDPMANCVGSHGGGSTPKVYVNGIYHGNYSQLAYLISTYEPTSFAKIEGKASFAADRKQIIVNTKTQFAYKGEDNYRIQYLLVEENVGPFEETGNQIFQHVTRGIYNSSIGVISTPYSPNQPQECNFAIPLADNIQNFENLHVVAMLINDKTGEVANAVNMSIIDGSEPCFALDKPNLSLLCDVTEKLNVIDSEVPNANAEDYVFTSSNENVVKVLEDGFIRAIGAGSATIICKQKDGLNSAQCKVTERDWANKVTVTTPGTLRDKVGLFDYTELKIDGNLNDKDMGYIFALIGLRDNLSAEEGGVVRRLNLKDAKLENEEISSNLFHSSPLSIFICPSTIKRITDEHYAEVGLSLRYITLYEGLEQLCYGAFSTSANSIYLPSTLSQISLAFKYSSVDYCWVDSNNPYYFAYNNDIYTKETKSLAHFNQSGRYELILPDWCEGVDGGLTYQEFGISGFSGRGLKKALSELITRDWRRAEFGPYLESVEGSFACYAKNLKEIVMPPLTPPTVVSNWVDLYHGMSGLIVPDPQNIILYVNPESIELYQAHPEWSKFFIQPMTEDMLKEMEPYYNDISVGIDRIRKDNLESDKVFDLSGRQITQGDNQRNTVLIKGSKKYISR